MDKVFPLEIRSFHSLSGLNTFIERSIHWYEGIVKECNGRLGELLRDQKGTPDEKLLKELSEKGFTPQKKEQDKKDKKSGISSSGDWLSFKGLMFSVNKQSRAEILFEAVDRINKNLERLKEIKKLVEELQKTGLSSNLVYTIYFVEGVPEKIFMEPSENLEPKYKFEVNLSTGMEKVALPENGKPENPPAGSANETGGSS